MPTVFTVSPDQKSPEHFPVAIDTVNYVGDAVAAVVAESREAAVDALEAVMVDYEELPAVTDLEDALSDRVVGDPQVRHRGTFGGSLVHGDPASDLPAVVLALGGTLRTRGPGGERDIPAPDFFTGFLETALGPDELLTEVRVPKAAGAGWSYQKFNRRALDWAIAGVAAVRNGTTGVALVNMGSTPLRATAVEQALAQGASATDAAARAAESTEPPTDLNASPEYRRHLARVLVRRALEEAGA